MNPLIFNSVMIVALLAAACGANTNSQARGAFEAGNYAQAAEILARERSVHTKNPRARAEYELYSGLTHFALGDRDRAARHLQNARTLLEASPAIFSRAEQGRLLSAWRAAGALPGQRLAP